MNKGTLRLSHLNIAVDLLRITLTFSLDLVTVLPGYETWLQSHLEWTRRPEPDKTPSRKRPLV